MTIATQLRAWLLRQSNTLPLWPNDSASATPPCITNPYAASSCTLAIIYADIVQSAHTFGHAPHAIDAITAEIRRIRTHSEQLLYNARLCESLIKQLLYCTAIPEKDYKSSALGGLLEDDCTACRRANRPLHSSSYLGCLAHRYRLCHEIDHCLHQHILETNTRRNREAAHANIASFSPSSIAATLALHNASCKTTAETLIHMLQHISHIECAMIAELRCAIIDPSREWWKGEGLSDYPSRT